LRRSWGLARRGWKIWGSLDWFKGKSAGNPHSEWEKPMVSWRFSLKPMRGRVLSKKKGEHHKNHRSGIITRDRLEIFHLKMWCSLSNGQMVNEPRWTNLANQERLPSGKLLHS
jgi:hypothetical protein